MKRRSFMGAVFGSLVGGAAVVKAADPAMEDQGAAAFLDRKSKSSVFREWPQCGPDDDVLATCGWDKSKRQWELLSMTLVVKADA